MHNGYVKVFSTLLESTVWMGQPPFVKLAWITLLARADNLGVVTTPVPSLASLAGITLEEMEEALDLFQKPDRHSRSQEHEGRRITPITKDGFGGFKLLNYSKYRDQRDKDKRREQLRDAQRRHREKVRLSNQNDDESSESATLSQSQPKQRQKQIRIPLSPSVERGAGDPASNPSGKSSDSTKRSNPRQCRKIDREPLRAGGGPARLRGSDTPTQAPSQDPHGTPRRRRTRLPSSWQPTDQHREQAQQVRVSLDAEVKRFRDYYEASGKVMANWDAAFRGWLNKIESFRTQRSDRPNKHSESYPTPQPHNGRAIEVEVRRR